MLFFLLLSFCFTLPAQLVEQTLSQVPFRNLGPAFMSGRISDIAKDPKNLSTWYVAAASGNLWKTTNNGTTWKPIFDDYGSFSLGCITIDPKNSNILWLGTGENQSQRSVSWGDGIYKSLDAGKTWKNMGLKTSEHLSKILVHPQNSNVVYVAAQGPLWAEGGQRGVFKTTDGGQTWTCILKLSENTGVSDLVFDSINPEIIYAASYQRRRHVGILVAGGPESRIYKTNNGGANWEKLSNGLPSGDLGRIALAVSPQKNNVVYALIAGSSKSKSGFYRSNDFGESWTKKNDYIVVDPQYYGKLFVDPHRFDHVYAVDVMIHYTTNGGGSFERLNSRFKHVDNHTIVFDPLDPDYLMVGCDGGVYESWDKGQNWKYHANLPITQFYRVGLDNEYPIYNVFGGTQDNSTIFGPSRTLDRHGVRNSDWKLALGGDGFQARVDPENANIIYCQFQYAGLNRYDKRTGQRLEIQPQAGPDEAALRWHWDAPLLISPHDSKRVYYAAQKVFRSDDRGDSWNSISQDLSRGEDRNQRAVMGKVWPPEAVWKNVYTSPYGTIVSLAESPVKEGLLIAGTDDGIIQISEDGGVNWRSSSWAKLAPERTYVADVMASQHDPQTFYAVLNNHKEGDFKPYVIKTTDTGKSWKLITKGLETPNAAWCIVEDHKSPDLLFLATEYGLFASLNAGNSWTQMKGKLPTIAFRDLEIQKRENDLVAASFGRGMYILDDYAWMRTLKDLDNEKAQIFPIKDAQQYFQRGDLGYARKGSLGANFYTADNPPFGAAINLFIPQSLQSLDVQRKGKTNSDGYPTAETLEAEDFSVAPSYWLKIMDEQGRFVSMVSVKNKKGWQRVFWDFTTEVYAKDGKYQKEINGVEDGSYQAILGKTENGLAQNITAPQVFKVATVPLSDEKPAGNRSSFLKALASTLLEAEELDRQLNKALLEIRQSQTLAISKGANTATLQELEDKRLSLLKMQYELSGDQTKRKRFEYYLPGIMNRLRRAYNSHRSSVQITKTHQSEYELAKQLLQELQNRFENL
ncbi:MAG: hypothetical protein Sapg2KO_05310 [Saprospiraceae bacterium]